jgi:DHA3 family tetracycline resistance protein-like MFS transporter
MTRLPATFMYYASEFWLYLAHTVTFTVAAVYFVQVVGMSPLQLVLVGTVMEVAVFTFEIPTGVVADTYSRRLSLVLGWLVMGAATVLVGAVAAFPVILAAYGLWGFGYTFTSGAHQAWITDEVGVDAVGHVFARGQQWGYVGGLLGIGVSVTVASVNLQAAVMVGGALTLGFALFAALFMPETGFQRPATRPQQAGPWTSLKSTAGTGLRFVRAQPLLLLILAIAFFAGASTESFDRLWQAHILLDVGLPSLGELDQVVWFGIFGAVTMVLGLVASEYIVRRFKRVGQAGLAKLLFVFTVIQLGAVIVFALSGNFALAVAGMWLYYLTRDLIEPVYNTWINEQITDSSVRATVISVTGQSDAVGQVVGGPGLGAVGSVFSIRSALLAGSALLAPALALYARAIRHGGKEPELADIPAS